MRVAARRLGAIATAFVFIIESMLRLSLRGRALRPSSLRPSLPSARTFSSKYQWENVVWEDKSGNIDPKQFLPIDFTGDDDEWALPQKEVDEKLVALKAGSGHGMHYGDVKIWKAAETLPGVTIDRLKKFLEPHSNPSLRFAYDKLASKVEDATPTGGVRHVSRCTPHCCYLQPPRPC